jgi:hypothetical protein
MKPNFSSTKKMSMSWLAVMHVLGVGSAIVFT